MNEPGPHVVPLEEAVAMAPHHQNVGAELVRHMADDGPGVPDRNLRLHLHLVVTPIHVLQAKPPLGV